MAVNDFLLLRDPRLYEKSDPVLKSETGGLLPQIDLLFATVPDFRKKYGSVRATDNKSLRGKK